MRKRFGAVVAATAVAAGAITAVAVAAGAPPPKGYNGAKATLYATGLKNPTSFAWLNGTMFAGDSGNSNSLPNGGIYVIKNHVGTQLPVNALFVGGLATHKGVLYASVGDLGMSGPQFQILALSGFNGATFTSQKAIYTAPSGFQGFNGLAFAPNGRLLVGVDAGLLNGNDHGPASTSPYLYDILSMNTSGKQLTVFARGMRQPWQMAFAPGDSHPFVSDLSQDCTGSNPCSSSSTPANPRDLILHVKPGQNYGFPGCNYLPSGSHCTGFAKPFETLAPHTDPMGMAIIGRTLYVGSFLGAGAKGAGALYSMPITGGRLKPVVTGFPLATDALAVHAGALYVGGSTQSGAGEVYKVTLKKAPKKKKTVKKHKTSPTFTG